MWFGVRANWLKVKAVMMAFLTINAYIFLVPMMPEMLQLAEGSLPIGCVSDAFV